jgi:hypothetical protein
MKDDRSFDSPRIVSRVKSRPENAGITVPVQSRRIEMLVPACDHQRGVEEACRPRPSARHRRRRGAGEAPGRRRDSGEAAPSEAVNPWPLSSPVIPFDGVRNSPRRRGSHPSGPAAARRLQNAIEHPSGEHDRAASIRNHLIPGATASRCSAPRSSDLRLRSGSGQVIAKFSDRADDSAAQWIPRDARASAVCLALLAASASPRALRGSAAIRST